MKGKLNFITGLIIGAAMFGGSTAIAAGILAEPSTQTFFVDGQQVQLEAYIINGHNYVQLRDTGRAVDFNVSYDGATNSVQIDSTSPYEDDEVTSPNNGAIVIPNTDTTLILKEGDMVLCDDGSMYTITDMSRYDANAFASGPLPELPTATCDWASFPEAKLPAVQVIHHISEGDDSLFIRNLYETRRMEYTLYNLAGNHPETSDNGKLKVTQSGTPYVSVVLSVPENIEPWVFWPWKDSQLVDLFNSCPPGTYYVEAWDVYSNGVFQHTRYCVYVK